MNVETRLKNIIKEFDETIDVDALTRDSSLKDDLGLSSVSMLYIAVTIEDEFGVDFSNANLGELKTVGNIIDAIEASR